MADTDASMWRKSIVKHPQPTMITTDVVYMFAATPGGATQGRYASGTLRPHESIHDPETKLLRTHIIRNFL